MMWQLSGDGLRHLQSQDSDLKDWRPSISLHACKPLKEDSIECSTHNPYLNETTGTTDNPEEVASWFFDPPYSD